MSTFNIGDEVVIKATSPYFPQSSGEIGEIVRIMEGDALPLMIAWRNGVTNVYPMDDIVLVKHSKSVSRSKIDYYNLRHSIRHYLRHGVNDLGMFNVHRDRRGRDIYFSRGGNIFALVKPTKVLVTKKNTLTRDIFENFALRIGKKFEAVDKVKNRGDFRDCTRTSWFVRSEYKKPVTDATEQMIEAPAPPPLRMHRVDRLDEWDIADDMFITPPRPRRVVRPVRIDGNNFTAVSGTYAIDPAILDAYQNMIADSDRAYTRTAMNQDGSISPF